MKEGSSTGSGKARTLIVLRHAKAERGNTTDHERPLTARGRRDALAAGRWIAEAGFHPDLTVCSTATRAKETWALAAMELGDGIATTMERAVYDADLDDLLRVVRDVPNDAHTVLLVGHNPGLQDLVLALSGEGADDDLYVARTDFGTAAIAVVQLHGKWAVLSEGAGRLASIVVARG
ncbi:MAG: SixA phosphatase family protein [Sporichthyaceae bacterium]